MILGAPLSTLTITTIDAYLRQKYVENPEQVATIYLAIEDKLKGYQGRK